MAAVAMAAALWGTACGGDDRAGTGGSTSTTSQGRPTEIEIRGGPGTERGRRLVAENGCLGCHRIGEVGNLGPGSNLTRAGRRFTQPEIERILLNPNAPMPSYESAGPRKRREIARYLASLR